MRMIDKNRLLSMKEIKNHAAVILSLGQEYEETYQKDYDSIQDKMDVLDKIWEIIVNKQISLVEILRKNGL